MCNVSMEKVQVAVPTLLYFWRERMTWMHSVCIGAVMTYVINYCIYISARILYHVKGCPYFFCSCWRRRRYMVEVLYTIINDVTPWEVISAFHQLNLTSKYVIGARVLPTLGWEIQKIFRRKFRGVLTPNGNVTKLWSSIVRRFIPRFASINFLRRPWLFGGRLSRVKESLGLVPSPSNVWNFWHNGTHQRVHRLSGGLKSSPL